MRKFKILLPFLFSVLLLAGCGKKEKTEEEESETIEITGVTTIDTLEDIKVPVYEKDLDEEYYYNPTFLNSEDDPAFYGYLNEDRTSGIAADYGYNSSDGYNTPYCYSDDTVALSDIEYNYMDRDYYDYDTAVMSNTGKQFEYYKKDSFLYEFTSPTTPTSEEDITSLSQAKTIKKFAEMLDEISFIHAENISLTSDIESADNNELIIKYAKAKINTYDGSELYGIAAGIEYEDNQYFYMYASDDEENDCKDIIHSLSANKDFDINSLLGESSSEKQEIAFDVSGTAGTIEVPSYFRNDYIDGNIYSRALTFVPSDQRSEEDPIREYSEEEGSTELYLTNEYYNMALTYNNFVVPEDCTTEYEMYVRALGLAYGIYYDDEIDVFGNIENNEYIVPRDSITDKDGNTWKSFCVRTAYKLEDNYPIVIPYYSPAVIYTKQQNNTYQIFTFSSALPKWWYNEEFVSSIDSIIASFSSQTSETEVPKQALTYYRTRKCDVNIEGYVDKYDSASATDATPTDSTMVFDESGDIDEGKGHKEYIDTGKMKGTTTGDDEADKDGLTQEYIDSLPILDDEVE